VPALLREEQNREPLYQAPTAWALLWIFASLQASRAGNRSAILLFTTRISMDLELSCCATSVRLYLQDAPIIGVFTVFSIIEIKLWKLELRPRNQFMSCHLE
jgi:hypothetical protein